MWLIPRLWFFFGRKRKDPASHGIRGLAGSGRLGTYLPALTVALGAAFLAVISSATGQSVTLATA